MLLPQLDLNFHIFCPAPGAVRKKALIVGNRLVALRQPSKIFDMSEILVGRRRPADRTGSDLAPPCTLHGKRRPAKLKLVPTLN